MLVRSPLRPGPRWVLFAVLLAAQSSLPIHPAQAEISEARRTPIVNAVEAARTAVVNIHGEKLVDSTDARSGDGKRRVNGMGTGVIIDERGYIITNHHVVDGVKKIMVTTASRQTHVAKLISHDPKTDLAVIKIDADQPFDVLDIGTSSDLMCGETVIAIGNAYGYEHTVTVGLLSALHRSVQVSETQHYDDLIQTDAAINPGNSGGPLLNIEGRMIGLNVAVRAGAQGIGFAIPVDKVLNVASDLLTTRRVDKTWHGVHVHSPKAGQVAVQSIEADSPAANIGLKVGDVIASVDNRMVSLPLDVERAILGHQAGDAVAFTVERNKKPVQLELVLAGLPQSGKLAQDPVWDELGLRLEPVPARQFQQYKTHYRGGLLITDVRNDSPASRQGIRRGDVLVGMHVWETVAVDNVSYVLTRPDFAETSPLKFYILRGSETLYGHLTVSHKTGNDKR
ncbi:MAG: trypsin-like peptidase domain-containing protein [Planctomycetes bacterium]|nr:trypsin-like peptidase domain-containing protein [Planctomycetota bacterium]